MVPMCSGLVWGSELWVYPYLLVGQSVQPLDVRTDEGVQAAQDLLHGEGRQEEAQGLHEPHALAALRTRTHTHVHTQWSILDDMHYYILFIIR